jgi:hypothetical protein
VAAAFAGVAVLCSPPTAFGDGDPASDTLLGANVFYPYQPVVSLPLTDALNETVARAHSAGFPVKVALIAGPDDLGSIPFLFGRPQRYAEFLDQEITFKAPVKLIVAMPQGVGEASAGPPSALRGIVIQRTGGSDALARAAIAAITVLAARSGHPISPAAVEAGPRPRPRHAARSPHTTSVLVLALAALALALGWMAALRLARRRMRGAAARRL